MIRLQIFSRGQVERDESFSTSEVTIGRTNANRLCLPANGVSARHCVIRRAGSGFELEDLASTNGTYVNRRRVRGTVAVGPQDEIIVATFTIRIAKLGAEDEASSEPPTLGRTAQLRRSPAEASSEPAASPKARAAKNFAPPRLPTSEVAAQQEGPELDSEGQGGQGTERSGSDLQWPEPLPEVSRQDGEDAQDGAAAESAAKSGSFRLGPVGTVDPEAERCFAHVDPLAQAWRQQGESKDMLLDGHELGQAQLWLSRPDARPAAQPLHHAFVAASVRSQRKKRMRWVLVPLGLCAAVGVALAASKFALKKDFPISIPDVGAELAAKAKLARADLGVEQLEPWLEKDPSVAVKAAVAKLQRFGPSDDAETWAWEGFLRKALRHVGGPVLMDAKVAISAMAVIPGGRGFVAGAKDGTLQMMRTGFDTVARSIQAHTGPVKRLLVGEKARYLYSLGEDNRLLRWDLMAPIPEAQAVEMKGLEGPIVELELSPTGKFMAVADGKHQVFLWPANEESASGDLKRLGQVSDTVRALHWEKDRLYVGDAQGNLVSWSADGAKDGAPLKVGEGIAQILVTPDRKTLILRGDERRTYRVKRKGSRWGKISSLGEIAASGILKLDRKGRYAISVASEGEILMWDPQSPDPARVSVVLTGTGTNIAHLALDSRSQSMVAADEKGALWTWELAPKDGKIVPRPMHGTVKTPAVAALGLDELLSRWLVARVDGSVRAADPLAQARGEIGFIGRGHRGRVRAIAVSSAGHLVLSGANDQRVRLWGLGKGGRLSLLRELKGHRAAVTAVAFDRSARFAFAASQDGSIMVWDLQQPEVPPGRSVEHSAEIYDMLVTEDGKWLITVGGDAKVLAYPLKEGKLGRPKPLTGHKQAIFAVASDPQSHYSVSGGQDRGVVVWDLSQGLEDANGWRLDGHDKAIWAVAISPDLQWIASGGEDRRIHVHRVASLSKREPPAYVLRGHEGTVSSLAFGPKGRWLVSGGGDRELLAWDLSSKRPDERPLRLSGHKDAIKALSFVAAGRVVSASRDGVLRLWNLHLQDASAELVGHTGAVDDLVLARGGEIVITASQDKTLRSWPISRAALIEAACQRVVGELSPELWRTLFPGQPQTPQCAQARAAR